MNKKQNIILLAVGVTVLVLGSFLTYSLVSCKADFHKIGTKGSGIKEGLDLSISSESIKRETKYATIEIEYPKLNGASDAFNLEISNYINETLAEFNKNSEENWKARFETKSPGEDISEFPKENEKFTIMSDWQLAQMNENRVSILLTTYQFSGGAHGSTVLKSFNYDVKTQKNISLADLFPGDENYINKVSGYAIADLKQQLVGNGMTSEDSINEGAGPRLENFGTFTISKNKVTFYFGQYTIGAYALGIKSVDMYLGQ